MGIHFTQKRVGFAKFPHYSNRKGTLEKEMQQKKVCILLISIFSFNLIQQLLIEVDAMGPWHSWFLWPFTNKESKT